jgi:5-methylcytosine-specific restriction endonuclease McrA
MTDLLARNKEKICVECGKSYVGHPSSLYCEECKEQRRLSKLIPFDAVCQVCGARRVEGAKIHKHHRIPKAKGGGSDSDNLIYLCSSCHKAVHTIRYKQSLSVSQEGWVLFRKLVEDCVTRWGGK